MSSDESDESDKEEYDELGSESRSAGIYGTILYELLHGLGIPLGVTLSYDESWDGDGGSLSPPYKILEKRVPENVPALPISFLLH